MKKALVLIIFLTTSASAIAHSGRTDSSGGHNCSSKSQSKGLCSGYHYHNGTSHTQPAKTTKGYKRDSWKHWSDNDDDCQNTRHEILIRDSSTPVKYKSSRGCKVVSGTWLDPYTNNTYYIASDVDIDHIIPLSYAHKYGGANWPSGLKEAFANDTQNLITVDDSTNQSKGNKPPSKWLPPNRSYHSEYRRRWTALKAKYNLR